VEVSVVERADSAQTRRSRFVLGRREFLTRAAAAGLGLAAGGLEYSLGRAFGAPARPTVALTVVTWTFDVPKIRDNLAKFETWVARRTDLPAVNTELINYGFGVFDTSLATRFVARAPVDVAYSSDHWLARWARMGWIVPIEDHKPEIRAYSRDIDKYALDSLTYDGKLYGLPYYADAMHFAYNKRMIAEAGFADPPKTWDEVLEQAIRIRDRRIAASPILMSLTLSPWLEETWLSMIYSEGGSLFDRDLNPLFGRGRGGVARTTLEWLVDAIHKHRVMPPKVLTMTVVDVQQAFKGGEAAFCIVPSYMMLEFNEPRISAVAGHADTTLMPGKTRSTVGFTRMYVMGSSAVRRGASGVDAAWALIEYLGGRVAVDGVTAYHVPKRWAAENGLGFAITPLWGDPDVQRTFARMGSVEVLREQKRLARAKEGVKFPGYAEWVFHSRREVQRALLRERTAEDTMESLNTLWARQLHRFR
jgi:multiple sugar transport system substrate-binding protein